MGNMFEGGCGSDLTLFKKFCIVVVIFISKRRNIQYRKFTSYVQTNWL